MAHNLCIWVEAHQLSAMSLSKWPHGNHIGFWEFQIRWYGFRNTIQVCFGISISNFMCMFLVAKQKPIDFQPSHFQNCWLAAILDFFWFPSSNFSFGFECQLQNFSGTLHVFLGRNLLNLNDVRFKMSIWWPCWIFWFSDSSYSLAFGINSQLC